MLILLKRAAAFAKDAARTASAHGPTRDRHARGEAHLAIHYWGAGEDGETGTVTWLGAGGPPGSQR